MITLKGGGLKAECCGGVCVCVDVSTTACTLVPNSNIVSAMANSNNALIYGRMAENPAS